MYYFMVTKQRNETVGRCSIHESSVMLVNSFGLRDLTRRRHFRLVSVDGESNIETGRTEIGC
jgi:hypothetical protein